MIGIDLALSVPGRTITANPKLVGDAAGTARTLASLLSLSEAKQQSLVEAFTTKENSFVYVARQIDTTLATTVASLRPGRSVGDQRRPADNAERRGRA